MSWLPEWFLDHLDRVRYTFRDPYDVDGNKEILRKIDEAAERNNSKGVSNAKL